MKTHIVFLFLFSFAFYELNAQQLISNGEIKDLLNSSKMEIENPLISNFALIRQINEANSFYGLQSQEGSLQNNILVNQRGINNSGFINQSGSGLETKLWQYKTSNEANLWSDGKDITMEVKQYGNDNSINSFIENYFLVSRSAYLHQNGNNNRIELALFGNGIPVKVDAQQVQISQTGNDHSIDAVLENTFAPISITQTPGVNGEGMQVNISNSDFYFPTK